MRDQQTRLRSVLWMCVLLAGCDASAASSADRGPSQRAELGGLELALTLPGGTVVLTVEYTLSRSGVVVRSGVVPVPANGAPSVTLGELEPGTGYLVSLRTERVGAPACTGAQETVVVEGETSTVNIVLQCAEVESAGAISVNGAFDSCPTVTSTSLSPTRVAVGQSATLAATARDRNGDAVTFRWSAASGSFSASQLANTQYTCSSVGRQAITLTLSDGTCGQSQSLAVDCDVPDASLANDGGSAGDGGTPNDAGRDAGMFVDAGIPCCVPSPQPGCCMAYGGVASPSFACQTFCDGMPLPGPGWQLIPDVFGCPMWRFLGTATACCGAPPPNPGTPAMCSWVM